MGLLLACVGLWLIPALTPLPKAWRAELRPTLLVVTDRDGRPLAERRRGDVARLPVEWGAIDSTLITATLAAEDRRFFHHPGIDPLAIARALAQNIRAGRAVSGGSTLSQQLVKLLDGRLHRAGPAEKLSRMAWALVLEAHMSKRELLRAYLNRAPYGPTIEGCEAAARLYFGHPADRLSLEEAALLAALPQSPSRLDPRRNPEAALRARNRVLERMALPRELRDAACARDLGLAPEATSGDFALAPHWIERVEARYPLATEARIALDRALESGVSADLRGAISELARRAADDGAIVVIDNRSNEVRAWVGSPDYRDPNHGQFDAVLAHRQPGSALKPFEYALAFEEGLRPSSLLPDLPLSFPGPDGTFTPGNYAGEWHGPVRARLALANSWNAPAVALLASLGPERLLTRLRALGISSLDQPASRYGLGLALGVGEVTLLELTEAYATLARGGMARPRVDLLEASDASGHSIARNASLDAPSESIESTADRAPRRVIDRHAAFLVNAILSDPRARATAFGRGGPFELPFPCAIKTGTSSDWRDNWAFGWSERWTVGVWIGRAGGEGMDRVSGTEGAILALRRVLLRLHRDHDWSDDPFPAVSAEMERRVICPLSGLAAGPACPGRIDEWFPRGDAKLEECGWHHLLAVDVRANALARRCTPNGAVAELLFTTPDSPRLDARRTARLDPLARATPAGFERWAREQGWPTPPDRLTACLCGRDDCGARDEATARFVLRAGEDRQLASLVRRASSGPSTGGARHRDVAPSACRILRPVEGSIYAIDPSLPRAQQALALEAAAGADPVRWTIDGNPIGTAAAGERIFWPLRAGTHRVRAERVPDASVARFGSSIPAASSAGSHAGLAHDEVVIEVEEAP